MDHTDSEMMREAMGEALVQSLPKALPLTAKELVRDPEFWAAANEGLQEHVSNKAGSWLMKGIWKFVSKALVFVVLGSVVYAVGGWSLVAKLFAGGGK
jgi:hypothetical protein